MINLSIDIGNNLSKIGVFEGDKIIQFQTYNPITIEDVEALLKTYGIQQSILADVSFFDENIEVLLHTQTKYIKLSETTALPFTNLYESPNTLGKDRIAIAAAAIELFPNENVLLIDAGTCITFDFVNKNQEYLGGSITPGISMRFKALHNFTARLPLLTKQEINYLIGKNTDQSILSGVLNGIVAEMNGMIDDYAEKYDNLIVVVSGGDMPFFETRLKNKIFAVPNLVLRGLNKILNHNAS